MGDVSYALDLTTSALQWGDGLYDGYGYDRSELANTVEWWTDHIHPDDAMILNQAMERLTDPRATEWTVAYRFMKADHTYVLVTDHAVISRDGTGTPLRLTGALTPKTL